MSLKFNLRYFAGLEKTRLDDDMHVLSNKSKYNLRTEATLIAKDFKTLGFKSLQSATKINENHIQKLIQYWQQEKKYSTGTIENKITALKHILKAAGNFTIIPAFKGDARDILNQKNLDKSSTISEQNINNIKDLAAKSAIKLAVAYGLRKEESIHIVHSLSLGQDVSKNDLLIIKDNNGKASLAKNGRPRDIKMHDNGKILFQIKQEILSRKLNLKDKNIQQFRNKIDNAIKGLKKATAGKIMMHGFRHAYAQSRYFSITGLVAPAKGGKKFSQMNKQEQALYLSASRTISQELGHNRVDITRTYIGK